MLWANKHALLSNFVWIFNEGKIKHHAWQAACSRDWFIQMFIYFTRNFLFCLNTIKKHLALNSFHSLSSAVEQKASKYLCYCSWFFKTLRFWNNGKWNVVYSTACIHKSCYVLQCEDERWTRRSRKEKNT